MTLADKAREGIERCKRKSPQLKSEVELLTESLDDKSALVRRQAVEGLSTVLADGAGIDAKVIVPALRDPDSEVPPRCRGRGFGTVWSAGNWADDRASR